MKSRTLLLLVFAITLVFASCDNPWWPHKDDVTVRFDANGGEGTPPAPKTVMDGENVTMPPKGDLTRTGYNFYGWNTKADLSGTNYSVGAAYKTSGSATLYARWWPVNSPAPYNYPYYPVNPGASSATLKVTYYPDASEPNARGRAVASGPVPGTTSHNRGEVVRVQSKPVELSKPGFVFAEWVNHPNYITQGESLSSGSQFTINSNTDLWALWLEENKVISLRAGSSIMRTEKKITFDPRQPGYSASSLTAQTMTILNQTGKTLGNLNVKITYAPGSENAFYHNGISAGPLATPLPAGGYGFSIVPRTGLGVGNYSIMIEIEGTTNTGERVYASFIAGFVVSPIAPPYTPDPPPYQPSTRTVTFNANGADGGTVPAAITAGAGSDLKLPGPGTLKRYGYIFEGWNTNADGSGTTYPAGASYTGGGATLYAVWTEDPYVPPFTITYLGTGADPGSDTPPPKVTGIKANDPPVMIADKGSLKKAGYHLSAWEAADGSLYAVDREYTINRSLTLKPLWLRDGTTVKVSLIDKTTKDEIDNASTVAYQSAEYDYSQNDADIRVEQLKITNVSGSDITVGPFWISELSGRWDAFELCGTTSQPPSGPQNTNHATVGDYVTGVIDDRDNAVFSIKPRIDMPAGVYSMKVVIEDANGNTADFAMTFEVTPIPLTLTIAGPNYALNGNPNAYLTPILAGGYSERTAGFTVTVSGFANEADANDLGVILGDLAANAVVQNSGYDLGGNGASVGPASNNGGKWEKAFTVTVSLNDTTGFPSGSALIYAGIDTSNWDNQNYDRFSRSDDDVSLTIHDGQADTAARAIPVNQTNGGHHVSPGVLIDTADGKRSPFNVYMTEAATRAAALKHHYVQTEDIVLRSVGATESNWTSIGGTFTGSYDGDNKTISGLKQYGTTARGMFEIIGAGATVKNLGLLVVQVEITAGSDGSPSNGTGALAAGNSGTVDKCYSTGVVKGLTSAGTGGEGGSNGVGGLIGSNVGTVKNYSYSTADVTNQGTRTGGLVGQNQENAQIIDCWASGDVYGKGNGVGGVTAGKSTSNTKGTVIRSHYKGKSVTGEASHVGGVVGYSYGSGVIVDGCTAMGAITGVTYVGGVVGYNNIGTVTGSYFSNKDPNGNVIKDADGKDIPATVTGSGNDVGGVVGYSNSSGIISYCFATGTVTGKATGTGGIIGRNEGTVKNCFFMGDVNSEYRDTGGIVGQNKNLIQNCYSTGTVTGTVSDYIGGVAGITISTGSAIVENCYSTSKLTITADRIGGLLGGYNSNGILRNSVALNPSVTRLNSTTNVGRVQGQVLGTGTRPNNYARWDMRVGSISAGEVITDKSSLDNTSTGYDGADVYDHDIYKDDDTDKELLNPGLNWAKKDFWETTLGWSDSVWDFTNISANSLPTLQRDNSWTDAKLINAWKAAQTPAPSVPAVP